MIPEYTGIRKYSARENFERNLEQLMASERVGDGRWLDHGYLPRLNVKGNLCAAFVAMIAASTRLYRPGFSRFRDACRDSRPAIIATWHGSMIVTSYCFSNHDLLLMTSHSVDGDIIARIAVSFGFHLIRGSSSRGGMRGLLTMVKLLQNGKNGSLTVDGPRGPRHEVKPGVVMMARKSGACIVPVGVGYSHVIRLKNWDRTEIPVPGSKVAMLCGEPFMLDDDVSVDDCCALIGEKIHQCERAAAEYIDSGCLVKI